MDCVSETENTSKEGKWRLIFSNGEMLEQLLEMRDGYVYPRYVKDDIGITFSWESGITETYLWSNMIQAGYWPPK